NRDAAKEWAKQQAGKLSDGTAQLATGRTTLARIFAAYAVAQHLKAVGASTRYEDERCAAMWTRVLGAGYNLARLGLEDWLRFIHDRQAGAIDAWGEPVPEPTTPEAPPRRPVGPRTVESDCEWL